MRLRNITIVALALLPFHACLGMDNSALALAADFNRLTIEQATQTFSSLSSSTALRPTPKKSIEENFKKAFGYPIPTNTDDYQKTTFKNFIKDHALFNAIENSAPQQSPRSAFETLVKEISLFLEQKECEEKQALARQNASREKIYLEIQALKQRLAITLKERDEREQQVQLAKQKALTENLPQKIEATKQRLRKIDKNNQKKKKTQQKKQSSQTPQNNRIQQILAIKRSLRQEYNCQTDAQVKNYLSNKCKRVGTCCMIHSIESKHVMVHYKRNTNELIILIGDEIDSYDFEHDGHESDDESCD